MDPEAIGQSENGTIDEYEWELSDEELDRGPSVGSRPASSTTGCSSSSSR